MTCFPACAASQARDIGVSSALTGNDTNAARVQAAQGEVGKAQEALASAEERVRAVEQAERAKVVAGEHLSRSIAFYAAHVCACIMLCAC